MLTRSFIPFRASFCVGYSSEEILKASRYISDLVTKAPRRGFGRPKKEEDPVPEPPIVGWVIEEEHADPNDGRRKGRGASSFVRQDGLDLLDQAKEVDRIAAERGLTAREVRSFKPPQEAMTEWTHQSWEEWVTGWRARNAGARRTQASREKASGKPSKHRLRCEDCEGVGKWEHRSRAILNTPLGRVEAWTWKAVLIEFDRRIRQHRGQAVPELAPDPEPPVKKARPREPGRWSVCRRCEGKGIVVSTDLYTFDSFFGPLVETTAAAAAMGPEYFPLPLGANYRAMAQELRARLEAER